MSLSEGFRLGICTQRCMAQKALSTLSLAPGTTLGRRTLAKRDTSANLYRDHKSKVLQRSSTSSAIKPVARHDHILIPGHRAGVDICQWLSILLTIQQLQAWLVTVSTEHFTLPLLRINFYNVYADHLRLFKHMHYHMKHFKYPIFSSYIY